MRTHGLGRWFAVGLAAALAMTPVGAGAEGTSGPLLPLSEPAATTPPSGGPTAAPARPAAVKAAHRRGARRRIASRRPRAHAARRAPTVVRAFPPPTGETRFAPGEILVAFASGAATPAIDALLRRHRLTTIEAAPIGLVGLALRRARIADARAVGAVVRELGAEPLVVAAQPDYVYALQDAAAGPPQYALDRLHVDPAPAAAAGDPVLVAVIDTAIDESHPDLAGAVAARFDALGGAATTRGHGTAIAGAIAAHGQVRGVAPHAAILSARAFETAGAGAQGTSFAILRGVDWAAGAHARVINMSFAGPADPLLHRALAAAFDKDILLVAAAGNAGPKSPPLFPAADEKVLAVTATDADDKLFADANVGRYVALAAPGVDVLLPAPEGAYDLETGTSVSAALVSGVAALVVERRPGMAPGALRKLLVATARPLGAPGDIAFGAGLVDAARAVAAASGAAAK